MIKEVATKTRLRQEYASGDYHAVIVKRLNKEGCGRKVKSTGELKPWTQAHLSKAMVEMGLRRTKSFVKGKKRRKATRKAKRIAKATVQVKTPLVRSDCIAAAVKVLRVKNLDVNDRVDIALQLLEA